MKRPISRNYFVRFISAITLLLLLGCDGSNAEKPKPKFYPGKVWHKPSDAYPTGLLEVTMNGTYFRVPGKYVGQRFLDTEFFDIYILWPEMEAFHSMIRDQRTSPRLLDKVRAWFKINDPAPYDTSKFASRFESHVSIYEEPYPSIEAPDLLRYPFVAKPGLSISSVYTPRDPSITQPDGTRLFFGCDEPIKNRKVPLSDPALGPRCRTYIYWPNGLNMVIDFYRTHLKDAVSIYQKIMALRESWVVQEARSSQLISGE